MLILSIYYNEYQVRNYYRTNILCTSFSISALLILFIMPYSSQGDDFPRHEVEKERRNTDSTCGFIEHDFTYDSYDTHNEARNTLSSVDLEAGSILMNER